LNKLWESYAETAENIKKENFSFFIRKKQLKGRSKLSLWEEEIVRASILIPFTIVFSPCILSI